VLEGEKASRKVQKNVRKNKKETEILTEKNSEYDKKSNGNTYRER
jgi:hypothetical protein